MTDSGVKGRAHLDTPATTIPKKIRAKSKPAAAKPNPPVVAKPDPPAATTRALSPGIKTSLSEAAMQSSPPNRSPPMKKIKGSEPMGSGAVAPSSSKAHCDCDIANQPYDTQIDMISNVSPNP